MRRFAATSFAALAFVLGAPLASAHIDLTNPPPRHDDPLLDQKDGPCGVAGSERSANPTVLTPGQVITIEWSEPVEHESYFRLAFDAGGETFPLPVAFDDFCEAGVDWCVEDNIEDGQVEGTFSYDWTVPEEPCDNCTLQLIQVMLDDDGLQENDFYYDCADLVILDPGGTTSASSTAASGGGGEEGTGGSASSGDGGAPSSGPSGPTGGNDDDDDDGDDVGSGIGGASTATGGEQLKPRVFPNEGGCAIARGSESSWSGVLGLGAPLALALGALVLRRRRR